MSCQICSLKVWKISSDLVKTLSSCYLWRKFSRSPANWQSVKQKGLFSQCQQHKPEHVSRQYCRYKDCNGLHTVDVNLNLLPPPPRLGVPKVFLEAVKAQCCTIFCWCSCFSCLNLDLCLTPFDTCALTQPRLGVCFGSDPGDWETLGPAERSPQPLGNSLPSVCVELLCSMF